jgi:hypothetical protein
MLGTTVELTKVGVLLDKVRWVLICFNCLDQLRGYANAGVVGWDGGVATRHANDDMHIGVTLLANTRFSKGLTPDFLEGCTFVNSSGNTVLSVALEEEWSQVASALAARDLFVETE